MEKAHRSGPGKTSSARTPSWRRKHPPRQSTAAYTSPCFIVDDQIIWGATAMIISELRTVLGRVLK
ncbi:MAG: hypothetical protein U5L09_05640 [Bacteroidales bacterium]|nr:hypothetical protein [Bacteroidales bacterium]